VTSGKSNQVKVFLVCVITAAFIWLMDAINTGTHTFRVNYPIHIVYDDSLYLPAEPLPTSVTVNVSGRGWRLLTHYLRNFTATPVVYSVSNPLKNPKLDSVILKEQLAGRFQGFQISFKEEEWQQELAFELKSYKVVQLKVDSAGITLDPGYAITSIINMSPSLLSIEGSASQVKDFPDSLIVRIPEKGIRANYESKLPLELPASGVKISHESVYVSFEVSQI